ncbi:MAG: ATP-binding protein [Bacteroidales bacterium]|nr:ATP-binding protein [Bacteroidales bacterium]
MALNDRIEAATHFDDIALKRTMTLLEISRIDPTDQTLAFQEITKKASMLLNVERVSIWLYNQDNSLIQCKNLYILNTNTHTDGEIFTVNEFQQYFQTLEESRCLSIPDAQNHPLASTFNEKYFIPHQIYSLLDIPILSEGRLTGVFSFESTQKIRNWTVQEQDFGSSIAEIIATHLQVHQRRQVEKALILSEEKYRKIIDNSIIAIYRTSISGKLLFFNQAMIELFEFENPEEALAFPVENMYNNQEDRENFLQQILSNRLLKNYDLQLRSKKGNIKSVIINAYMEEDTILGMVMDITKRKKYEEEIKAAQIKAEESDRFKTSLMANMSHEFRTPMNAILGFSDLIAKESQDPDLVFFARKIHLSGRRLMATLKAILDLADLQSTQSKIKISDIDLQTLIAETIHPFSQIASEKNLYIITEFKDSLFARADENLLQVILYNIVDNSIKFTSKGGVTIETDIQEADNQSWVVIRVKDTGIGIPREQFDFIFHEFRQLSEGYNRSYEGTGLGLTIALRMVEMIKGKITVESEVGLGSIFTIWLPAINKTNNQSKRPKQKPSEDVPSYTFQIHQHQDLRWILIVEDNDDNAEIIKLYLKGKFFTERATDANTAIQMASEKQFSGILMDINLGPGMDGMKATSTIRQLPNYKQTPIIAITGYTMTGDREKLLDGGCSHYLGKPFSQQDLLGLMTEIFDKNSK